MFSISPLLLFCRITLQNGTVVDFGTLQCTLPGKADSFKIYVNFSGEFVPYVVTLSGPEAGVSPDDKVLLNSIPQSFIGHKWLWWWNRSGKDPFIDEYERNECKENRSTHPFKSSLLSSIHIQLLFILFNHNFISPIFHIPIQIHPNINTL